MPEIIEVEGGIARLITKSVVRQVPLNEVLKLIEKVPPITLPTLARSQVFAHWEQGRGACKLYMLCELPPAVRSITKNVRRGYPAGMRRYRLSMPWTYFWFVASSNSNYEDTEMEWSIFDSRIYFAKDKYKDVYSPFIVAPIPNLSSTGEVCWGSTGVNSYQSLADQIDQRVNEWYLSEFNDDLDSNVYLPYGERNMRRWVQESRENSQSWQNWPEWIEESRRWTVKKLLTDHGTFSTIERFAGGNSIPEIQLPMTYGRWDEFWADVPVAQRNRALRSLENIRADNPDIVENEEDDIPVPDNDDGGVPA